jgi:hypothetical protein
MPKSKPPWNNLTVSTLGVLIHTALRKSCDSLTSSLAWNAIGAVCDSDFSGSGNGWTRYLEQVLPFVRKAPGTVQVLAILKAHTNVGLGDLAKREHQDLLIRLALAQLTEVDWQGVIGLLESWASN